ncbi:hypothetical protein BDV95DRAFT_603013 [Massariosphaeria phaeospora]|uniref:F-box domain-containing protein n=1 Tax=Massariosphaeria phaeospora TaxID=100035 RepID=A0A7C8IBM5_9PLEO|nr:hypothetical protein BDV95DRAFT_603013 [Massariosphaeria phaeospora]
MAALTGLADELLLMIIEPLDAKTLARLCRVTRNLYRISEKRLYREIEVRGCQTILKLMYTFYHRPELFPHVERLALYAEDGRFMNQCSPIGGLFETLDDGTDFVQRCHDWVKSLDGSHWEWLDKIQSRYETAFAGILLISLYNVKYLTLEITESEERGQPVLGPCEALFGHRDTMPITPMLDHFNNMARFSIPGRHFALLNFPYNTLSRLDIDLVVQFPDIYTGNYENILVDGEIRPLKRLDTLSDQSDWTGLSGSYLPYLPHLITSIQATQLTRFELCLARSPRDETQHLLGSFAFVITSLRSVAQTLEHICITVTEEVQYEFTESGEYDVPVFDLNCLRRFEPISTLQGFNRLKSFAAPQQALVHRNYGKKCVVKGNLANVFPESLEKLTITHLDAKMVSWLDDVLHAKSGLPGLRSIALECSTVFGKSPLWFVSQLGDRERFVAAGIALSITDLNEPWYGVTEVKTDESGIWGDNWDDNDWGLVAFGG